MRVEARVREAQFGPGYQARATVGETVHTASGSTRAGALDALCARLWWHGVRRVSVDGQDFSLGYPEASDDAAGL